MLIVGIALIICGVLAAASLIVQKQPNAKELIDKLVPIQGWIGIIVCLWGLWNLIQCLLHVSYMSLVPVFYLTWLAVSLVAFGLGFLLGFGLISKYMLSSSPQALAKGEQLRAKLATIQIPLGLVAIGLGLWGVISSFVYHV
jgi:hypothetical protein